MADIEDTISNAKDKLPDVTPTPEGFHPVANAHELKSRLNWGEPGLTILDVRDRDAFNAYRIMGAEWMPIDRLGETARMSLEPKRDIYVYGTNDEETRAAADQLRSAGFFKVAELKGGVAAFKDIGGSVEGNQTPNEEPSAGAYNVAARLQEFAQNRAKEDQMDSRR